MLDQTLLNTIDQILLDKVVYDTDIPEWRLRNTPKFWDYWTDYLISTDTTWTIDLVVDYALEMGYNGEFGDNLWQ